jgi:tetratricopeptide (TPR) repeat protein
MPTDPESKSQEVDVLQGAVRTCRDAVECADPAAPDRDSKLECLLDALIAVYETNGDPNVIEEAIAVLQEILLLRPGGHPRRGSSLIAYGRCLQWSFTRHSSNTALVKLCIDLVREALQLHSLSRAERFWGLYDLSTALKTEFTNSGGDAISIIAEAISAARESLDLCSPADPLRVAALNCLASPLLVRWEHLGNFSDASEAVSLLRQSLSLCPPGHSNALNRSLCLNNLAVSLMQSYWHRGDVDILTEAIALQREVLELWPPGHPRRDACLGNLGYSLLTRYEHKDDPGCLPEAIELFRECLALRPAGHPDRMTELGHLADALLRDFERHGDINALEEAITLLREALVMYPSTHARRSHSMDILGKALVIRFQHHGDIDALMQGVDIHREALQLRPEGHPERPLALSNLAPTLRALFVYRNDAQALEEEAEICRMGLLSCPEGHSRRGYFLSSLGNCLLQPRTAQFDLLGGLSYVALGLADSFASTRERLQNAIQCLHQVERAYRFAVDEHDVFESSRQKVDLAVLEVYIPTIHLLPRAANLGLNHAARLRAVSGSDVVSRNAAVRAMGLGREMEAVEMLEEGRGVFWYQTLQLRASGLDHIHKDDRHELQRIFRLLEEGINCIDVLDLSVAQRESQAEARRQLSDQAEELITKLRSQPGLERLLMPPAFSSLIQCLPQGFVVMLLTSDLGHRALILQRGYNSVRSLELKPSVSGLLSETTRTTLPRDWDGPRDGEQDFDEQRLKLVKSMPNHSDEPLVSTMASLWSLVVKPVIEALGLKVSRSLAASALMLLT